MLSSSLIGLGALLQCLAYIAFAAIFIRFSILLPWMEFRSRKLCKKYPKMWLSVAIITILSWLLYSVLFMDKQATGGENYHIIRRITFIIGWGTPVAMLAILLIIDVFRKRVTIYELISKANEIRSEKGLPGISPRDVAITHIAVKFWTRTVCDNHKLSIADCERRIFVYKVFVHLLVKKPKHLLCGNNPDAFFKEALGDDFPVFKDKFPEACMVFNWKWGIVALPN